MPQLSLFLLCLALAGHQAFGQTTSAEPPRRRIDHFLSQLAAVSPTDGTDPHAGHQHDRGFSKYRRQPSLLDLIHQPETRAGTKGSPSPLPFAGVDAQKKAAIVDVISSGVTCDQTLQKSLMNLGFKITGTWGRVCSGWLPLDKVTDVEALDGINFVRTCLVTTQRGVAGKVESEGRLAIRASPNDLKRLPYDGTGVTVGVLSDSFDTSPGAATRMADDVASGDLPGLDKLRVVYEEPIEQSDEGRAMAQIVHDVAPGAEIEFYSVSGGQAAFAAGIDRLAETCQVIVDDVSYLDEPMFMDGIIGKAIDKAVQNGVVFVSAAGNQGHASYEDAFTPGPSFARHSFGQEFLGGIAHTFDGVSNQRIVMRPGSTLALTMQWAQPFFSEGGAGSNTDYDMYLLHDDDGDGRPDSLLSSATDDSIGSDPIETLWYHNGEGKSVTVFLMILHRHHQVHPPKSAAPTNKTTTGGPRGVGEGDGEEEDEEATFSSEGPPPPHPMGWIDGAAGERIKYVDFGNVHLNEASAGSQAGTLYGHRNARGSITVGSAYYKQTPAFGRSPPVANARSSVGGVPVWREGVWEESTKPDVVGPDGVSTTFFPRKSAPYFFGTSAAAPHVAAVAALMLQADPSLAPEDIRRILVETAVDMKEEDINAIDHGFDPHTGNGMVDAASALRMALGMEQEAPSPPYVTDGTEERPWGTIGIVLGGAFGIMAIVAIGAAVFFYKRHKEAQAELDLEMPKRPKGAKSSAKLRIFDSKRYAHLRNSHSDMSLSQSDSTMLSPTSPLTPNSMTMSSTGDFEMSPFFWHKSSHSSHFESGSPAVGSPSFGSPSFPKSSRDPISPLSGEVSTPASIPQRRGAFLSPTGLNLPLATSGDIDVILTAPTPKNKDQQDQKDQKDQES